MAHKSISRRPSPSFRTTLRGLSLAACLVGISVAASAARADDDDDRNPFTAITRGLGFEKIGEMTGLKKKEEAKPDIEYRERSPLVIPRSRDLPPPGTQATADPANWPKQAPPPPTRKGVRTVAGTQQPGASDLPEVRSPMFDSSDWTWDAMMGKKKAESKPFVAEPARSTLTQPPEGYQTPSPEFPYGTSGPPDKEKEKQKQAAAPEAAAASAPPASGTPSSGTPAPTSTTPAATTPAPAASDSAASTPTSILPPPGR
jgi:hypothetical protein